MAGIEKKSKYANEKTTINGVKFDSKREARRYTELLLLQRAGKVTGITTQVPFILAPAVKFTGAAKTTAAIRYYADFVYTDVDRGCIVVEDVKSKATAALAAFRIKRHLMKSVHDIEIAVVH